MKSIYIILLAVIFTGGCNRSQNSSASGNHDKQKAAQSNEKNAKNSFNYHGSYLGVLPCADCEGMETEITLKRDNTFVKKTKYLGKGDRQTFEEKGKYSWDNAGNMIILEGITSAPNKYYVSEGAITQLDMSGNVITGELSEKYRLKKTL